MWVMQVRVRDDKGKPVWRSVKPTAYSFMPTEPYKYATREEAEQKMNSLYPDVVQDDLRVIEE